jgi:hypothetical protein
MARKEIRWLTQFQPDWKSDDPSMELCVTVVARNVKLPAQNQGKREGKEWVSQKTRRTGTA